MSADNRVGRGPSRLRGLAARCARSAGPATRRKASVPLAIAWQRVSLTAAAAARDATKSRDDALDRDEDELDPGRIRASMRGEHHVVAEPLTKYVRTHT